MRLRCINNNMNNKRIQQKDIPEEDLRYLVEERHISNKEIGFMMGCSLWFISDCIKYYGIVRDIGKFTKAQYKRGRKVNCKIYDIPSKEDIEFLYIERKMSMNKIKDIFSTSIPTLKKWMMSYGINIRSTKENSSMRLYSNTKVDECVYTCLDNKQWLIDAYSECSMKCISDCLGVNIGMIRKHIHKHNIDVDKSNKNLSTEEFITKSKIIHGDKYDYSNTSYNTSSKKLYINCPIHGLFYQKASDHYINGAGCPKCGNNLSKSENEIAEFLSLYTNIIRNDKNILDGKELDIYIPELKIAIEYNGLYWHSERSPQITKNYHKEKTDLCLKNDIRLIHIWEDDWSFHKERIKNWLLGIININKPQKIYGRCTKVIECPPIDSKELFETYHIQGFVNSSKSICLMYDNKIISSCLFKRDNNSWNLTRYVTNPKYQVIGGFLKIIKNFQRNYIGIIYTFADLSWVHPSNNVYERNGFNKDKYIPPDYRYIYDKKRCHKFGFRHKNLSSKLKTYDSNLTEHQNCLNNQVYRIYDCGKIRYIFDVYK